MIMYSLSNVRIKMRVIMKDACDECKKFDVCIGYQGKVLCPDCLKKIKEEKEENKTKKEERK